MSDAAPRVLVIEDEPPMRRFLRAALDSHGYRTLEAASASEGTALATSHNPELVLLDLGLPDGDGIELTRRLREWMKAPIIVISARGQEADKVAALDAGADDYLTKPFGIGELLARMRVALRHARSQGSAASEPVFESGTLRVDFARRVVTRAGDEVRLTPIEHKLLALFAHNAGKVLTHRQILGAVWGPASTAHPHHVRVHVGELRKKIEDDPARPRLLITEPGVGYRLRDSAPSTG